jgi:rRNA processing protein Krr1/Pno1
MGLSFLKGQKLRKSDMRLIGRASNMRFFSLLQKSGYIEIRGKTVLIKKDFVL